MERTASWIVFLSLTFIVAEGILLARYFGMGRDYKPQIESVTSLPTKTELSVPPFTDFGSNLPAVGRSLFDYLVVSEDGAGWRIPFPFSKLLAKLARAGGCADNNSGACYQAVLIPLGRSLQRTAAAPDFFKYPRIVSAFSADPGGDFPLLKDRLYLGYQEKANLIEVISFNEAAGRFEFQLVTNYRKGAAPNLFYANRSVCVSCHQNQTPIFSRQVWDETNANPEIAKRLVNARSDFHGLPIRVGVDVPNAIDDATDRSNILTAYESLWRDGCGDQRRCRARALAAALQYRLTNERGFDFQSENFQRDFVVPFEKNWQMHWPDGMKIPSNDVPNRDPLQFADSELLAHVPARFEALLPRAHKEIWQWETDRYRLIKGIGEFFSANDIRLIAEKLAIPRNAKGAARALLQAPGFVALDQAIERLLDDPLARAALDAATIQRAPLRDALFRALKLDVAKLCCAHSSNLPAAKTDENEAIHVAANDPALNYFYLHCARCHATREPFPPNFMSGDPADVQKNLRRCADRIYFRLSMWQVAPDLRPKTPMPPANALTTDADQWAMASALAAMRAYVAPFADRELKNTPDTWLGRSYEALRSCTLH